MERIEVITSVQRRRRYTGQEKAQFVAMTLQPGSSVSSVARQYGITPSLLFKWKKLMQDGGVTAVEANDQVVSVSDYCFNDITLYPSLCECRKCRKCRKCIKANEIAYVAGVQVETKILKSVLFEEGIVETAKQLETDLIVMG